MDELAKRIEAILFVHGDPMTLEELVKLLSRTKTEIRQAAENLDQALSSGALTLVWRGETLQLTTKQQFAKDVETLVKEVISRDLSRTAAETLAVISYRGPLSRPEIDYIRGVNSSYTLRNLLIRGLIYRALDPKNNRSYLYQISVDFLKFLGLNRQEQLPEYAVFKKRLEEALKIEIKTENQ
jgi:segregation and condensation protein B